MVMVELRKDIKKCLHRLCAALFIWLSFIVYFLSFDCAIVVLCHFALYSLFRLINRGSDFFQKLIRLINKNKILYIKEVPLSN